MLEDFGVRAFWAAAKAAFFAILDMLGIRKRAADDGARQQREKNDEDTEQRVREAEGRHDQSADETGDELRARARRDWLQRG